MKQVPKSTKIEIDPVTKTLIRNSAAAQTNPDDLHALIAAVDLKNTYGGEVVAVSMGPEKAKDVLREALALGADRALLISDRAFAGSDTFCTSYILAKAAKYIGDYKLLLFGRMAIDGDTAQVGPEVAAHLDIPQLTGLVSIDYLSQTSVTVKRNSHHRIHQLEVELPSVLVVAKTLNAIPNTTLRAWEKAQSLPIETLSAQELDIDPHLVGLQGSPTRVVSTFLPKRSHQTEWLPNVTLLAETINGFISK